MADIGVKMGVTGIAQFKQAMQQGTQSVKTLDAALKKNEAQYKATGDAEAYMQQKTKLLEQQIKAQKGVCDEAEKALETMTKQGVDPASKAYQQMQQQLLNSQTALLNMQNDLNGVGASAKGAADGAQQMNTELKHIGKQVDFQGVLTGIGKITDGLEKASKNVINFAGNLWNTMKDAASWADDQITLSQMYGISVEDLQRMQKTAEIIDTPVEAIIKARQKLSMGLSGGFSADQMEVLGALGLVQQGKYGAQVKSYQNAIDMLWDVGAALDAMGDSIDRDAYAQQLFGRSWMELQPMFKAGRQAYDDTMNSWDVVAEENVNNLGTLDDSMKTLEGEFETLKLTVISELAPAFNKLAGGLTNVLRQVNEYLQTDEGQEKLQALGEAVTRLFENITNIDTGEIIDKVSGALDSVTKSLEWIWENKEDIVNAIKAIAGAFIALKAVEVVGSLAMGANALKNLLGGGAASAAGNAAGGAAGGAVGKGLLAGGAKVLGAAKTGLATFGPIAGVLTAGLLPAYLADQSDRQREIQRLKDALNTAEEAAARTGQQNSDALLAVRTAVAAFGESDRTNIFGQAVMGDQANIDAALGTVLGLNEGDNFLSTKTQALLKYNGMSGMQQYLALDAAMAEATEALQSPKAQAAVDVVGTLSDALDEITEMRDEIREHEFGNGNDEAVIRLVDSLISNPTIYGALSEGMQKEIGRYLDPESGFGNGSNNRVVDAETMMNMLYDEMNAAFWANVDPSAEMQASLDAIDTGLNGAADAAEGFAERVNSIMITGPKIHGLAGLLDTWAGADGFHANGLPWVPYDNYLAFLHRGERVVPASQNRSYTANNNLYVDRMYMNNGTDADALAARIAEQSRRTMSGFGG